MKIKVMRPVEVEIKTVRIVVPNRYGDEDIPSDFPGLIGKTLVLQWDIDTGKIDGWPAGRAERIHMKVTDEGSYTLHAPDGSVVLARTDDYVPHSVVPGEYGDYVVMSINGHGLIEKYRVRAEDIEGEFTN